MSRRLALGTGRAAFLALALLVVQGCGMNEAAAGGEIEGVIWRWVSVAGTEPLEVEHPGRYTLEFGSDGRWSARADCNQASGAYTQEGERLSLGPAASTMVACPPGSHGTRYLQLLARVERYRRDGDRLVLTLAGGRNAMELKASRELALAGSSWVVRAVNNGRGGVVSVALGTALDLTFGEDGRVTGSAGCNRFNGSYTLDGESLGFGPAAATRRMCARPERIMEQEAEMLAALGTVARQERRGERLQLRTAEGSLAIDLVAAVAGTLTPRGADALPPDARAHVQLEDVSLADAPSKVLGETFVPVRDQTLPLLFHVVYDPSDIDPRHSYSVHAVIEDASGRALYRTTEVFPVLTRDGPTLGVEVGLDAAR